MLHMFYKEDSGGENVWEAPGQKQGGRSWVGAQGAGPLEVAVEGWRTRQVQDVHWNQGWQDKLRDWTLREEREGEAKEISASTQQVGLYTPNRGQDCADSILPSTIRDSLGH